MFSGWFITVKTGQGRICYATETSAMPEWLWHHLTVGVPDKETEGVCIVQDPKLTAISNRLDDCLDKPRGRHRAEKESAKALQLSQEEKLCRMKMRNLS